MKKIKEKIVVALSGGVDSAMAVVVLKRLGFKVIGVHFVLDQKREGKKRVEKIAKQLKIKLVTWDVSDEFEREVVDNFVNEYERGNTPNPCVICNSQIKFKQLLAVADEMGIEKVATGHYARIEASIDASIEDSKKKRQQTYFLNRADDPAKDQSYFLYRLGQKELSRIVFPLSRLKKEQVKKEVEKLKLKVEKTESQDVCFFSKNEKLNQFLKKKIQMKPGIVVDEKGNEIGKHKGIFFHTIGQRHGLNLNGGPFYVIEKRINRNEVVVSGKIDHPRLWKKEVKISGVNWAVSPKEGKKRYACQVRYQTKRIGCKLKRIKKDLWVVMLERSAWGVTTGQSLVVCDGERVVGGGIIC